MKLMGSPGGWNDPDSELTLHVCQYNLLHMKMTFF